MSSAETVANIEELLTNILVSVPPHSVARFKCASKHWPSLISNIQNPKISAFFSSKTKEESFKFIPLRKHESPSVNPFKSLNNSVPDGSKLKIIQSCNGLFLCLCKSTKERRHDLVYVFNPTTNQFRAVSSPRFGEDMGEFAFVRYEFGFVRYALAFDPSKSPHYKVVCVTNFNDHYDGGHHEIDIYSSETGKWKHLDTPFFPSPSDEGANYDCKEMAMHFDYRSRKGTVYCNGAVHWIRGSREARLPFCTFGDGRNEFIRNESDVLHYFDVGEERLLLASATPPVPLVVKKIPLISSPSPHYSFKSPSEYPRLARRYFGECCGRLYLIETYQHCSTEFEVMEMEKDYSGWFVKYNVDLSPVFTALPRQDWNAFVILCLSQEEETSRERHDEVEDSSTVLLLHIPGKVISYNLRNKTFRTSVELANKELFLGFENRREDDVNHPYVKSSACV